MKVFLISACLALAVCSSNAGAKPPEGKPAKPHKESGSDASVSDHGIELSLSLISVADARSIAVSEGVTGYKPLPPGIRKNLARGKPMPPGIAKTRMPDGMLGRLPVQSGYEWRFAGSDLLLIELRTERIADVLIDVFR